MLIVHFVTTMKAAFPALNNLFSGGANEEILGDQPLADLFAGRRSERRDANQITLV